MRKARARKRNKPRTVIVRGLSLMPDRVLTTLLYAEPNVSVVTGQPASFHIFRSNSLYDPNQTAGGHQPMGYDQWAAFYDQYIVHKARIMIDVLIFSQAGFLSVTHSNDLTQPTNMDQAFEMPYSKHLSVRAIDQSRARLSMSVSLKKFMGKPRLDYTDDAASIATDPVSTNYFIIRAQSFDNVTNMNCSVSVRIVYYAEFFDRKQIGQS